MNDKEIAIINEGLIKLVLFYKRCVLVCVARGICTSVFTAAELERTAVGVGGQIRFLYLRGMFGS